MVVSVVDDGLKLTEREQLVLIEIGKDKIDSASSFVSYISEEYGLSKSSAWYVLNRLKDKGIVDFASKDELGKPLALTAYGLGSYRRLKAADKGFLGRFESIAYNYG